MKTDLFRYLATAYLWGHSDVNKVHYRSICVDFPKALFVSLLRPPWQNTTDLTFIFSQFWRLWVLETRVPALSTSGEISLPGLQMAILLSFHIAEREGELCGQIGPHAMTSLKLYHLLTSPISKYGHILKAGLQQMTFGRDIIQPITETVPISEHSYLIIQWSAPRKTWEGKNIVAIYHLPDRVLLPAMSLPFFYLYWIHCKFSVKRILAHGITKSQT